MRALAVIVNLVIVGLGHVFTHRHLAGFLHFLGFAICADGVVLGGWITRDAQGELLVRYALAGGALLWMYSQATLMYRLYFYDAAHRRRELEVHFQDGIQAFFCGRYGEAREEFRACLALDERNIVPRYFIAQTFREERNLPRARRVLQECRSLDRDRRWAFEIDEVLQRLDHPEARATARLTRRDAAGTNRSITA